MVIQNKNIFLKYFSQGDSQNLKTDRAVKITCLKN